MSVVRVGSSGQYAAGWDAVFGASKAKAAGGGRRTKKAAGKKSAKKATGAKASKPAQKAAKKSKGRRRG